MNKKILFLLDLPDPVHGMSSVNQAFFRAADVQKLSVVVVNTVPSYAASLFGSRFWGGVKIVHTLLCWIRLLFLLAVVPVSAVYRPINGGLGQVYDLGYIVLCRVFFKKIFIHHHSFNYLNRKGYLFTLLNNLIGKEAVHIVLGSKMEERLSTLYGVKPEQIELLSNVAFFKEDRVGVIAAQKELVIGYLANLCVDKGIGVFASLCRELKTRNVLFRARIAGPFVDTGSESIVNELLLELDQVEYLGSVYGNDKEAFFQSIDVFIFPSKYKNEAEPLVLYEAGQYGVLNFGTQRGCMEGVITSLKGHSFPEDENLVINLANGICEAIDIGALGQVERKGRIDQFKLIQSNAQESLNNLIAMIGGYKSVSKP